MFIPKNNVIGGGGGFVPAANNGYLNTATGYPATLAQTLAKKLDSITVHGAQGGVGDKTANLLQLGGDSGIRLFGFSAAIIRTVSEELKLSNGDGTTISTTEPANNITVSQSGGVDTQDFANGYFYIGLTGFTEWTTYTFSWDIEFSSTSLTNPPLLTFYTQSASGSRQYTGAILNGKLVVKVAVREVDYPMIQLRCHGASFTLSNCMLVKGSYTAATMPPYEPYGYYELPIAFNPPALPRGYTRLESITVDNRSDNGYNGYINLNYIANENTRFVADCQLLSLETSNLICGAFGTTYYGYSLLTSANSTTLRVRAYYDGDQDEVGSIDLNRHTYTLEKGKVKVDNGDYIICHDGYSGAALANTLLFQRVNGSGYIRGLYSYLKMYRFKLYDGDTLVRDCIPAKRNSDGEIGMYDVVNDVFYTNSGTGTFEAGAEAASKMIYLYSDTALGENDSLEVDIKNRSAMHGSTDVSALQDWDQDMKMWKAEEIEVAAGTEVKPSDMEIGYYSSAKG